MGLSGDSLRKFSRLFILWICHPGSKNISPLDNQGFTFLSIPGFNGRTVALQNICFRIKGSGVLH